MRSNLTRPYGTATGPLGFPLTDRQAFALDDVLKVLPREEAYAYRRVAHEQLATTELQPGERADVSWITTEDPDRCREVVLARGLNDAQFALNPIVTLNHAYDLPPVGKSLWRKRARDGERVGIKAKTQYPARPATWRDDDWPPDCAFALVQAELLRGKSIGFLPLKVHAPTAAEIERHPGWAKVSLVIDEWLLLEYACVYLPAQQHAVVEAVSKSLIPPPLVQALGLPPAPAVIPFTPLDEVARAVERHLQAFDVTAYARRTVQDLLDRRRGRV